MDTCYRAVLRCNRRRPMAVVRVPLGGAVRRLYERVSRGVERRIDRWKEHGFIPDRSVRYVAVATLGPVIILIGWLLHGLCVAAQGGMVKP